ncbi:hypothetical protein NY035_10640 [Corynebacterium diphtheriae bv. mitis]|uniref:hypothetical protein n=1 Tax=Corynebacterium diphtheriae TaxID=1717 RepID=UPI00092BC684|nr:hypothetical protein [Corynebacterium diphtheriae]MBG9359216.1 hypothetical protein [Corynebacterium diphtheriae bv. mitis]MBG9361271.1 hypothetical protein [Corynebacterium diphtheriae bv. mitis]MBG9363436.1 hypothetical protein [Corynebacterium diphtheriae bv. mitis]MBG9365632.1 hypothetical protein [Corynebacterium diphtheriae bv. mitis]OJH96666.1 hypothetical protein BKD78_06380 [Corynebacterium diphtheriae]
METTHSLTTDNAPTEDQPILSVTDLHMVSGTHLPELKIYAGLSLVHCGRENSATTLSMTLAGRMKPISGTIELKVQDSDKVLTTPRQLHKAVALAGVPELDSLERLVPVTAAVREQLAWSQPWYRRVPRDVTKSETFINAAKLLDLPNSKEFASQSIGDLDPLTRFRLRIALALIARPHTDLLIVDDIDQIRSLRLRADLLRELKNIAASIPVVAMSANDDVDKIADHEIHVAGALQRKQKAKA